MAKRILIVEDDPAIATTVEYNLAHEGFETRVTGDGRLALEILREFRPDLILLDLLLPGLSGYEVCRRVRNQPETAATPIVILTACGEEDDVVRGLEAKADDYITKPFRMRALVARVRNLLERAGKLLDVPPPVFYGPLTLDREKRQARLADCILRLSKIEFDLLCFLLERPGRVFTRNDILSRCWPDGVFVVDRAVDVHVSAIRRKLGPLRDAIETVWGVGYRVREPEELSVRA